MDLLKQWGATPEQIQQLLQAFSQNAMQGSQPGVTRGVEGPSVSGSSSEKQISTKADKADGGPQTIPGGGKSGYTGTGVVRRDGTSSGSQGQMYVDRSSRPSTAGQTMTGVTANPWTGQTYPQQGQQQTGAQIPQGYQTGPGQQYGGYGGPGGPQVGVWQTLGYPGSGGGGYASGTTPSPYEMGGPSGQYANVVPPGGGKVDRGDQPGGRNPLLGEPDKAIGPPQRAPGGTNVAADWARRGVATGPRTWAEWLQTKGGGMRGPGSLW